MVGVAVGKQRDSQDLAYSGPLTAQAQDPGLDGKGGRGFRCACASGARARGWFSDPFKKPQAEEFL